MVERIRGILLNADGVNAVGIDNGSGNVTVNYDPGKNSPEKLAQLLRDKGYGVRSVEVLN